MNPSRVIAFQEFESLGSLEKSEYLRSNFHSTAASIARRPAAYGYAVNDGDYLVRPRLHGIKVRCPAYSAWAGMLVRVFSEKYHVIYPTYIGVTVCQEWLHFMEFRRWWVANQVDGYCLDKDLLCESREYGPSSCIFVPAWLNAFTSDSKAARGECPIGVDYHKKNQRYRARCRHPFGEHEYLGCFETPAAAHLAWKSRKLEIAKEIKPKIDEIDTRIYPRIVSIIEVAK